MDPAVAGSIEAALAFYDAYRDLPDGGDVHMGFCSSGEFDGQKIIVVTLANGEHRRQFGFDLRGARVMADVLKSAMDTFPQYAEVTTFPDLILSFRAMADKLEAECDHS